MNMNALKQSTILSEAGPKVRKLLEAHKPYMQIIPQEIKDLIPPSLSNKKASVLVPIIHVVDESFPSILFTTRSGSLKAHANQISFPGGHVDEEDGNCIIRAALRETREELTTAHNPHRYDFDNGIIVLGRTENIPSMRNTPVTPVIAMFKEQFTKKQIEDLFPGNESEVSNVFTVPIDELSRIEKEESLQRLGMKAPFYETEHGKIWGLTAVVLQPILQIHSAGYLICEMSNRRTT
jgi:8-oxo-dGTP pyrophosphatase MutT (NUDIX family)